MQVRVWAVGDRWAGLTVTPHLPSIGLTCDQMKIAACWEPQPIGAVFWPRTAAAVQPAAALKTPVRTPQGEYEEEMQLPSAGGTGDGGHCCRCVMPGALFLLCTMTYGLGIKTTRTRHATLPPAVPMVEGGAEGRGGGDLANGPLDGRTNRGSTPDDDERHPWRIPLDRPCLLTYLAQKGSNPT